MDQFRQVDQSTAGPATPFEDERALSGQGALEAPVVVWDDRRGWQAQCPLDLDTTVMVAAVVAVDEQGDALRAERELVLKYAESGAGVPEPDQIG